MKIILGINAFHSDSSACLIINGELICALEEERLNRQKHTSRFPILAIKECLKISGIKADDVTDIAVNTNPKSNILQKIFFILKSINFHKNNEFFFRFKNKYNLLKLIHQNLNIKSSTKYHNIEHHLSHISSAFFPSRYEKANGLSIDGSGDFVSLAISECNNHTIKITDKIYFPNSLGIFYHAMTQFLNFKNIGDEYKVMGLASFGKPLYYEKILNNIFENSKSFFKLNQKFFKHSNLNFKYKNELLNNINNIYNDKLRLFFKDDINKCSNLDVFQKDFAASVQKVFEKFFIKVLEHISKKKFSKNIVYAGGCALNSSANNNLINSNYFENIFIPYAPGDNGGSIGAALSVCSSMGYKVKNLETPYLGNEYNNNDVEKILEFYKKKYELIISKIENFQKLCDLACNDLINSFIIGWFQGKMEFGPRALGNRSILADPRIKNIKDIINKKIKKRENFRPFAPSVLKNYQNEWFLESFDNVYMSSILRVRPNKIHLIPSVVHVDGTSRVQTVSEEFNKNFFYLISRFYQKTGVPILLNTSFNENEPIVNKPEEALDCLVRTDMDSLFINNYYIKKV